MRLALPAVLVIAMLGLVACSEPAPPVPSEPVQPTAVEGSRVAQELVIPVTLTSQFFQPAELAVNVGDTVTLRVSAPDQMHAVKIAEYTLEQAVDAGQTAELMFTTYRAGDIVVECTLNCDAGVTFTVQVS